MSGMGQDRVDRLLVAVDHVDHAVGHARLLGDLGDAHRARRVLLRGLEHEGVAAGERHREHPERDHRREIERRDAGAHPERLAERQKVDPGADVLAELALEQLRDAARELDHLDAAHDLALGVGERLAVLGADQVGQLVNLLLEQVLEPEHDARAAQRGDRRPFGQGFPCGLHRSIDLGGAGERHASRLLADRRIEDVAVTAARAGHAPAAEPVPNVLAHGALTALARCASASFRPGRCAPKYSQGPRPVQGATACRLSGARERQREATGVEVSRVACVGRQAGNRCHPCMPPPKPQVQPPRDSDRPVLEPRCTTEKARPPSNLPETLARE